MKENPFDRLFEKVASPMWKLLDRCKNPVLRVLVCLFIWLPYTWFIFVPCLLIVVFPLVMWDIAYDTD